MTSQSNIPLFEINDNSIVNTDLKLRKTNNSHIAFSVSEKKFLRAS